MGNHKLKWTQEEEDALISGVKRHGIGKWMKILADPQFSPILKPRTNVDLKDKWRNMHVRSGSKLPRRKEPVSPCDVVLALPATFSEEAESDHDVKNASRYSVLVFEALTTLKETNGSDLDAIVNFIEEKYQVPQDFRRVLLTVTLKTLVSQGKLEKVQNRYKIKEEASSKTKTPSLKRKDVRPRQQSTVPKAATTSNVADTDTAAYLVADAKNKACDLSEAVKELEKLPSMAEQNSVMLKLAEDIYRECARGATFLL